MAENKWREELDIFRKIKPCIVLEGNVFDRFHYEKDPAQRMRELSSYILRFLSDAGYDIISYYDDASGFYGDGYGDDIAKFEALCHNVPGVRTQNDRIPCAFSDDNSSIGEILSSVLGQTRQAVAVIMDMASRYIVSPDNMSKCEVNAYANMMRALRQAQDVQVNGDYTKNIVILLVNKVNDLPVWFYLDNPDVKTIHVSTPDSSERMEFISGDNLRSFFDSSVWNEDISAFEGDGQAQLIKLQKRFVGLTEGFTYSDLVGMRKLCINEKYRIAQLPSVAEFYRYGVRENKWAKISGKTIRSLEDSLHSRVLGQDHAISKVMRTVKRSVVLKGNGNRPRGVLFFAGPTGTGKTETAKALAEYIFGDASCCIRFDMSEYRQDHSDQKLLGAPPGYIGYEAGGQLTNAVRNNPFSIILFDEIEKAHPSILDKFLQILDDGRLTDGQGNTVYFSESIIIFTSNKGIIEEVEERSPNGIVRMVNRQLLNPKKNSTKEVEDAVTASIKNYFKFTLSRPEILNRIGENNIVVYDFIREEIALKILDKEIGEQLKALENDREGHIELAPTAKQFLISRVTEDATLENGGRGIKNLVFSSLLTPLSAYIADNDIPEGANIRVNRIRHDGNGDPVVDAEVLR